MPHGCQKDGRPAGQERLHPNLKCPLAWAAQGLPLYNGPKGIAGCAAGSRVLPALCRALQGSAGSCWGALKASQAMVQTRHMSSRAASSSVVEMLPVSTAWQQLTGTRRAGKSNGNMTDR